MDYLDPDLEYLRYRERKKFPHIWMLRGSDMAIFALQTITNKMKREAEYGRIWPSESQITKSKATSFLKL